MADSPSVRHFLGWFLPFSATMFATTALSWFFLLPQLTSITVDGQPVAFSEAQTMAQNLQASVTKLQADRFAFLTPDIHPKQHDLFAMKHATASLTNVADILQSATHEALRGSDAEISFTKISGTDTVRITGEVRAAEPNTMTILAAFVTALEDDTRIATVESGAFTRARNGGDYISPIDCTITLAHD